MPSKSTQNATRSVHFDNEQVIWHQRRKQMETADETVLMECSYMKIKTPPEAPENRALIAQLMRLSAENKRLRQTLSRFLQNQAFLKNF